MQENNELQQMPKNIEAETAVLGSLIIDSSKIVEVKDLINKTDFYDSRNQVLFDCFAKIVEQGQNLDPTTIMTYLQDNELTDKAGGLDYLNQILNISYSAYNIETYANLVKASALKRKAIEKLAELKDLGFDNKLGADEFIKKVEEDVFELSKLRNTGSFVTISQATKELEENMQKIRENAGKSLTGLDTGFKMLNNITLGFQPEQLIILAARPSIGKSALAINLAINVASLNYGGKATVAFFSLEMARIQLLQRIIACDSLINLSNIQTARLDEGPDDYRKYNAAISKVNDLNLFFDDSSLNTIEDIRTKCRKLKATTGLDFIVIDYLQLIEASDPSVSRQEQVGRISRGLKLMARELGVPVLALSQLSRKAETHEGGKKNNTPLMSDLRDSGSIEQDADVIFFLTRDQEDTEDSDDRTKPKTAILNIAKNRNGQAQVNLTYMFQGQYAKFSEVGLRKEE